MYLEFYEDYMECNECSCQYASNIAVIKCSRYSFLSCWSAESITLHLLYRQSMYEFSQNFWKILLYTDIYLAQVITATSYQSLYIFCGIGIAINITRQKDV